MKINGLPPFWGPRNTDGRIYGRGASDCKGLLTSQIMAMQILKRNGVKLKDGLCLISGADEEHGGRYGFEWLGKKTSRPLSGTVPRKRRGRNSN
ncbi:MAG: hypothetical protein CM1200mP3_01880 [Chloroflexota bacterium]|nr:MAG: hypothetical protein CM1200mP3_01880 [Chloroflexota bacterium]